MNARHLDHITEHHPRQQLHVPYLLLHGPITDRSPAADLHTEPSGRVTVRRHPVNRADFMVRITCAGHPDPVWTNAGNLAHRRCDDCLDIWTDRAAEAHEISGTADASLYALTDLTTTVAGRREAFLLHANELPDSWYEDEGDQ
ncbi:MULTISPECIES: hypothetical protein [Gordonia]|uniref:Uncharacterized protein n=1 Tax=Gordonia sihwensis NBRC 108236 TaxID=1223544 RepID=L7LMF2_9ACTN|nr:MULTISPECIES: hypothetical protein [Gordonia]AUH70540.1 hypothetical protein CXX93_19150 [Gordonia sp. YC-JH1]WFN95103.1 hypothetical protein P5P27_20225 [Gordonia sihwensis]GAC62320.1 hypothetical protein GSI01S_33_00060 [Gordonia sihwensis NBRC 108236]